MPSPRVHKSARSFFIEVGVVGGGVVCLLLMVKGGYLGMALGALGLCGLVMLGRRR